MELERWYTTMDRYIKVNGTMTNKNKRSSYHKGCWDSWYRNREVLGTDLNESYN